MKKTLLFIALTLFTNLIFSQDREYKEYHDNGNLKEIGMLSQFGSKDGEWKQYNEDGSLLGIETYDYRYDYVLQRKSYLYGTLAFHLIVSELGSYSYDLIINEYKTYHSDGSIESIGKLKINDAIIDSLKSETINNKVYEIVDYLYLYKTGIHYYYNENNSYLGFENYTTGEAKVYYNKFEIGQIKWEGNMINGTWKSYYENGQISQIGNYKNNKESGVWKEYHKNGQLELIGSYDNGDEIGVWKEYNKNGELIDTY
ncbi:MAG: hypothetical protein COA67_12220 [Lutibacter sp.]|nr:MAG: hypothetical protein COA67_12220 [Lutibacter sp.]